MSDIQISRFAVGLDLETLDIRPTALVTQIGLIFFDLEEKTAIDTLMIYPNLSKKEQPRGTIGEATVSWWLSQDPVLLENILFGGPRYYAADIEASVTNFFKQATAQQYYGNVQFWAGPAMFDFPILQNLLGKQVWDYQLVRCFTTLRKTIDAERKFVPIPTGDVKRVPHDAINDAEWMLHYLSNLYHAFAAPSSIVVNNTTPV